MSNRRPVRLPEHFFKMLDDLRILATIPDETVKQLAESLQSLQGFVTPNQFVELIADALPDESQGVAVINAIQNLRPEAMPQLLTTIDNWRNASGENKEQLPDTVFVKLQTLLPIFLRDYPALNRMQKAQRLMNVLGNEVKGIGFICDARPVYNKAHDEIEGMVPLTTFKIIYERQNLDAEEIEFVLSESDLDQLIKQANEAKKKLSVLSDRVNKWLPGGCVQGGK